MVQLAHLANRFPSPHFLVVKKQRIPWQDLNTTRELLLLDEPFGALDAKSPQNLRSWLRGLHEEFIYKCVRHPYFEADWRFFGVME